jgi:D-alanyl-D-alanine dipeptidase
VRPHYQIPIEDCGEPLVPLPLDAFAREDPHPYAKLGAPYGDRSPFMVRQTVLDRLCQAQRYLQQQQPWRILIFDAYRPLAVQQFMVDYTVAQLVAERHLNRDRLTPAQHQAILDDVYQFWAPPNPDPAMPPPHSTGAAVDITLIDENHHPVAMGSPIDELSPRSYPDHYRHSDHPQAALFHQHRQVLRQVMERAGFCQHPQEWWHFSWGDQRWAWQTQIQPAIARYGSV